MLRQYQRIKTRHKDCILFFRLGDFYEMFFEDAQTASKILDLVLTSRGKGTSHHVPMCGIPYHAAEGYIAKLIKAGLKVAICEQLEDPSLAKGIVDRDVIRIITAGTFLDENSADARFLLCLCPNGTALGVAYIDPATGLIQAQQYYQPLHVTELMARLPIHECVFPLQEEEKIRAFFKHPLLRLKNITLSAQDDWVFNAAIARKNLLDHFGVHNLAGFGIENLPAAVAASGALLEYLRQMNRQPLKHVDRIALINDQDYAYISPAAVYGLELENFFKSINHTLTAMGRRKLREWLYHPLKNCEAIRERQDAVTKLRGRPETTRQVKELLQPLPDIEKSISKLSCGYIHAKDLLALRNALALLPQLQETVAPLSQSNHLFEIEDIPDLRQLLERAIDPDVPLAKPEGRIILKGFHAGLDELRAIQEGGREWLRDLQAREIKRTGINSLKVGFNKIFGYYIEVTQSNLKNVPPDYIRKQTLVNAERFITPELKEHEDKILNAEASVLKLEAEILADLRAKILAQSAPLHDFTHHLALLDSLYSLSVLAQRPGYILPDISDDLSIDIQEGRHPVAESTLMENFVPNDTALDDRETRMIILTGPNMAGKSTYIRQTALLVILAQMGSFIPAAKAHIGIVDKIFTRIGAHDDITRGQSTFMVEMNEMADILNNLTERSLVILDEVGRGTSTFDGLSLAWALAEHLQKTKARTLFATHFHELTALAQQFDGIKNYNVAVKEWRDEIIFLHKIVPGSTDDSYGIYVAKLAGVPKGVIERAKKILTRLELQGNLKEHLTGQAPAESQLPLFAQPDPVMEEIRETIATMDINAITPVEALTRLQDIKNKITETH